MTKFKIAKENRTYLYFGITLCIVILFYRFIDNIGGFISLIGRTFEFIIEGIQPLFWALIITYFLYRPVEFLDKKILKMNTFKRHVKVSRIISIIIIYLLTMVLSYLVLWFVLPQIWESLTDLLYNVPRYVNEIQEYSSKFHIDRELEQFLVYIEGSTGSVGTGTPKEIQDILLDLLKQRDITFDNAVSFILQRIMSLSALLLNSVLSMFLSLYLLLDKETIGRQFSNVVKFIISKGTYNRWMKTAALVNEMFFKFFIGKVYCSIFVSMIVFLGLALIKVQHAALISLIIAITNIIPYFGPIIGGGIGVTIALLYSPLKAVWVLLLVIIAQQLDDNILGPRILGDRIGLKPFWIMLSVIIGGELFGVLGMFLAVPSFAVMKVICAQWMQEWKATRNC